MNKFTLMGVMLAGTAAASMASGVSPQLSAVPAKAAASPAKSVEVKDNQMWYGYYKGNEPIAAFGIGLPEITSANNAIYVNAADPIVHGKKIAGLRFKIQGKGEIYDISAWLSAELNIPVDEDLIASVPVAEDDVVDREWTEVLLPEPYEVPEEGVYAGYTVFTTGSTHESQYIGFTTNDRIAPDGALYDHATPFMSGWQSYGDRMGKLCYQVLLEGDFMRNAATAGAFGTRYVLTGESIEVGVPVTNLGSEGISSIGYVVVTDGVEGELKHITLDNKFDLLGGTTEIMLPLAADPETRYAKKEIRIVEVNGEPNEASADETVAAGGLVTLAANTPRKVVCETYTGTWCGWCPRDIVGNEKLEALYGDIFIPIEAHACMGEDYVDPMAIAAYDELKNDARGYPSAVFCRQYVGDSYSGLERETVFKSPELVDILLSELTQGGIEVSAEWTSEEKTRIKVASDVTFQFSAEESGYAIAYVVKADGLSKADPAWFQSNFYCEFVDDPEFAPGTEAYDDFKYFLNADPVIADMVYDDVAVAAYGLANGLPGSVAAPFAAGVAQSSEYTISVSNNSLIQDKDKLTVVAMLIDCETGRIVNADACAVGGTNGIESISGEDAGLEEVSRYDLMGRKLAAPVKGMNVVTYSDGSVKKVMEK